ncbi:MAG TPA: outer membrane protein assembly factor BamD [Devosiaceae bacterium]|nr:outer membrane protein assembly factor BamD [Devosiaceae bacterium]
MKFEALAVNTGRAARFVAVGGLLVVLAGCDLFGGTKIKEEPIVPPDTLYNAAIADMDAQNYNTALSTLKTLESQHPYSQYNEKAKLMQVFADFQLQHYPDAILAADQYTALFPASENMPYVLYLKGMSYFNQLTDITRDQQNSQNMIDAFTQIVQTYPKSPYAKDAAAKLKIGYDQLAGKDMSVGRYYEGNGQYAAAIGRFRDVVDNYQTSSQIEEALYRLTEANLALGLVSEAQTAAAVLGHNYPASSWYQSAYQLLQKQGVSPKVNPGSTLATALNPKTKAKTS